MITIDDVLFIADAAFEDARKLGYSVDAPVRFSINTRLTRTLGRFAFVKSKNRIVTKQDYRIEISGRFQKVCPELVDTVRHEIAHFIAYSNFNDSTHGVVWKKIASSLGAKPSPYVFIDDTQPLLPVKKRLRTVAQCVCCPVLYHVTKVLKLKIKRSLLTCPACKVKKLYLIKV